MSTMNRPGASTGSGEIPPLRLRLTHRAGDARSGALRIPAAGAGMADALELCGERQSDAQWRLANMCRVAWNIEAGRWQLLNGSFTLTCVVNGERVPGGGSVPIAEGDSLELGLLRFVVERGEGEASEDPTPVASGSKGPIAQEPSAFDLRELAAHAEDGAGMAMHPSPFGMLGVSGAGGRSTQDVLSALMDSSAQTTPHAAPVLSPEAPLPRSDEPLTLLDELHDEFVRVVRDPGQLAGRTDWEGLLATGGEPAPSLDDLQRQAEPYALLRDILLPREGIDRIIEEFEPLAHSGLLDAAEPEDVLSLFAPELARDAKVPLPGLTRREHHALSPDSHVRIGSTRTDAGLDEGTPH
ncbi:hypothetical protein SAMN05216567_10167 [Variovorax sp. OK605]|uniref:TagK domain-containing protein n=1 Tax=Variovorax sp. OK605 TaxID=1855317 RepID=UPI0008E4C49A|nr:TagK domain-containing protein [Variovorax sp. OK605]SFO52062.1 hypothetical protein SAMN05216567_10167 [Variovorax sp. OK605]